ncbi:MAG TPA: hypothetical protein VGA69_02190 [Nitriliruptorales bacterium]
METDATPVTLDVAPAVAPAVRAWLETIGWQVVDAVTAALVPPVLTLTDAVGTRECLGVPTVLLITQTDDPVAAATRAGAVRPRAVVRWPEERDRLPGLVQHVTVAMDRPPGAGTLVVGGASGGAGTTTIALALGGLAAWGGRRTLVAASGDVPSAGARVIDADALAGPGAWRGAVPAPGVPGLRVVGVTGAAPRDVELDGVDLVVVDVGTDPAVDVLVLRRDGSGITALGRSEAGVAVVVDHGPAHPRAVTEAAGGRRTVQVPFSARVARAGLARRVPAGLPGAWLKALAPIVRGT